MYPEMPRDLSRTELAEGNKKRQKAEHCGERVSYVCGNSGFLDEAALEPFQDLYSCRGCEGCEREQLGRAW